LTVLECYHALAGAPLPGYPRFLLTHPAVFTAEPFVLQHVCGLVHLLTMSKARNASVEVKMPTLTSTTTMVYLATLSVDLKSTSVTTWSRTSCTSGHVVSVVLLSRSHKISLLVKKEPIT
jgi:hypothetical protein